MVKLYTFLLFFLAGLHTAVAQSVLNPNDPIVPYNSAKPPTEPQWGQIGKWVVANPSRLNWASGAPTYKSYIYKGMQFRLKFPRNYDSTGTKKYPVIIFFHGIGEKGSKYDNEYQLFHGGELHQGKVDNGTFDGFLLYPQNLTGYFGNSYYDAIAELINNFFVPQINVDPFRIFVEGLSGGGNATWDFIIRYPKLVAALGPISSANLSLKDNINVYKYTPIWWFQGGVDPNPPRNISEEVYAAAKAAGANMKLNVYEGKGHGIWYNAWGETDYFPFVNRAYKSNPWPLFGRTEFCPKDTVKVTLGLTAGFDAYEWRKDGQLITTATTNTLEVTELGTYDARVKSGTLWSKWSPLPIQIKTKGSTISPDIATDGLQSVVLPTPEGKDSVVLQVPDGYTSYIWKKANDNATIGTNRTLTVRQPGQYVVKVTEQYGCSSDFSSPFRVVPANGSQAPDPASSVIGTALSKTSVQLNWNERPNPTYNETGFEVYRATTAGGPYTLASIVNADVLTYTDNDLSPGKQYYYIVRAVNANGAANLSNEAAVITLVDRQPPTPPGNLKVDRSTANAIYLSWNASTDDVGIDKYDVYVNGVKAYTVPGDQTTYIAYGLSAKQAYSFTVKARDITGNVSNPSNQVSTATVLSGLRYKYYTGTWTSLPDFNALTPVMTGYSDKPDIAVRTQESNFGFLWEGFIRIPKTGSYTFETYSDAGSKLYIGNYSHTATALVNNDGVHGSAYKEGTITLNEGVYPIAITYFETTGTKNMRVFWKNTAAGVTSRQEIPVTSYNEGFTMPAQAPALPSNITATPTSYNKITLNWVDNSKDETGFEIYRATNLAGPYDIIATTAANKTSYTDSLLAPQTAYYYKLKAVNKYGDLGFNFAEQDGLRYDYYEATDYTVLPDFNTVTPVKSGNITDISLSIRNREDKFALKFSGYINLTKAGEYTFYTSSDDGSKLYIDGFENSNLVVSNDHTGSAVERSGKITLAAGKHTIYVTYFNRTGGKSLVVRYLAPGGVKATVPNTVYGNQQMTATTLPLPTTPIAPSELAATPVAGNKINLQWKDNASNETATEVYRSSNNSNNYVLLATLPGNTAATGTFTDSLLFANAIYYYKVRMKNDGGISTFSNEAHTTTLNNAPVLNSIADRKMRFGTQGQLTINAADIDEEPLTITTVNLPAFATLADQGNGKAIITFNPAATDQGVYTNIQVKVTDQHNGVATRSFTLIVDDNYEPVISPVSNTSLAEKTTSQLTITANDLNSADVLTWSTTGLPAFATLTTNGNQATVQLAPGYADAGIYNVTVKVDDGRGGIDTKQFTITVTDVVSDYKVYIDFSDGGTVSYAPWNATNKKPALNDVLSDFKDDKGANSGMGIKVLTAWQNVNGGLNTNNQGYSTWQNTGLYPDGVMQSSWWTNVSQNFQLTGLKPGYKYQLTFFGSRSGVTDNRTATYTVGTASVSLNAANNATNTVVLQDLWPDADGNMTLNLSPAAGSGFAYINSLIVTAKYDDLQAAAKPRNLSARILPAGIRLKWDLQTFNVNTYEVYRATTQAGPYTLLNPNAANASDTAYTDAAINGGVTYYYALKAVNSYGANWSDTLTVAVPNRAPAIAALPNLSIKTEATQQVAITATDDPADVITLSATGLPSFITLQDNGGGHGVLNITPGANNIGSYTITVKATDNKGDASTQSFTLRVTDKNVTAVYVNCNEVTPVGAPWNSFNAWPNAGIAISNLKDESGTATGITITLIDPLSGANNVGTSTGNNSGVYPDDVMKTFFYDMNGTARRIRLSNVPTGRKYNLVFFGSREAVSDNRNTIYEAGGQSVTLNAASNTTNTVQINGLSPDASGNIDFTIKQAPGSFAAYLNSLVIQSYVDNGLPLSPSNLSAAAKSRNSIQLNWADKSSNETGFEIWSTTDPNSNYSLVTTVGANITSYQHNNLSENTLYYYKVRAITGTATSDYSNTTSAGTLAYGVYFNFNTVNPAPAPWNSTTALPYLGQTMKQLVDDAGNLTGIQLSVVDAFTGTNPAGKQTGNNTGVYPDLVMAESYYVEAGDTAIVKLSGLDISKEYAFTFFGSRASGGTRITGYRINGKAVTLDANDNVSNTVQLTKIVPDQNGELLLYVYAVPNFGYLNAMVLQAYPRDPNAVTETPSQSLNQKVANNKIAASNPQKSFGQPAKIDAPVTATTVTVTNVYPNPFQSFVYVALQQPKDGARIIIRLVDLNGRQVLVKDLGTRSQGSYNERLDVPAAIKSGIYILQVTADNTSIKSVKLIKQ